MNSRPMTPRDGEMIRDSLSLQAQIQKARVKFGFAMLGPRGSDGNSTAMERWIAELDETIEDFNKVLDLVEVLQDHCEELKKEALGNGST